MAQSIQNGRGGARVLGFPLEGFGFFTSLLVSAVAIVVQEHAAFPLLWIGLVYGVGQILESAVLTPLLVGGRIGLHPVAVIFAILAGGELFGFTGVLLALPVAAVIMVLVRHMHDLYKSSDMYGGRVDPDL